MKVYRNYSDDTLVYLLQQKDRRAFAEIYERYWSLLYATALKITRDEAASMDVVQDIYTDFWDNPSRFATHTSLRAYLYTTVRHRVIDAIKHQKVRERYLDSLAVFAQQYVDDTSDTVIYSDLVRLIEAVVSDLPPRMQRIFRMSRAEGLSYAEIAQELEITEHTVKKTINRALHVLRHKLLQLIIISLLTEPGTHVNQLVNQNIKETSSATSTYTF